MRIATPVDAEGNTMPMTIRAKCLMSAQSIVALATVALVLARAVNILGQ